MRLYWRLLVESVMFAWQALTANKMRTFLSLLGVTIGVFAIISVFTLVDSLEKYLRNSIEELGDNVVFVQKWPWQFGGDYHWWDYLSRPEASMDDYLAIHERSELADASAFVVGFNRQLTFKNNAVESIEVQGATPDYDKVRNLPISYGRYFTAQEFQNGTPVCIIGARVHYDLFGNINPIGRQIKIGGRKVTVIGMFEYQGESMIGFSTDELVIVPINYAKRLVDIRDPRLGPTIFVKAKEGMTMDALKDEITIIMRSARGLRTRQDSNFALNEISIISKGFDGFFAFINLIGFVIGGFSILVGGFSIANIMFVSVKERTHIIGIQKSLGARNNFILFQFLTEAVALCLLGGAIGLLFILLLSIGATLIFDMNLLLSIKNVGLGFLISVVIGLVSGLIPALSASRMDPVEAIRAKG